MNLNEEILISDFFNGAPQLHQYSWAVGDFHCDENSYQVESFINTHSQPTLIQYFLFQVFLAQFFLFSQLTLWPEKIFAQNNPSRRWKKEKKFAPFLSVSQFLLVFCFSIPHIILPTSFNILPHHNTSKWTNSGFCF